MSAAEVVPISASDAQVAAWEPKVTSITELAEFIIVTDEQTSNEASELLNGIRDLRKEVDATFDPILKVQYAAHKAAVAAKKKVDEPLKEACDHLSGQIAGYVRREKERREAEAALEAAEAAMDGEEVAPVSRPSTPTVEGQSLRETWSAVVTDMPALVKAVAAGTIPIDALQPNMTFLNQNARALKKNMKWPGVRAESKTSVARAR